MNKKISAVTLSAIMVLTIFSALVPAASAVTAEQVVAPYEFFAEVANISTDSSAYTTFDINSSTSPSILYYDFDEGEGDEQLNFTINNAKREIKGTNNFTYNTTIYKKDGDDFIAWLGEPYFVVESGGDWYLSKLLLDEDVDDTHLLRVGETLTLPAGFAITPLEIDVDGGEAWFSVTQDGEEVDSSVVNENATFQYKADLNDSGSEDNWVLKFKVETVFAGMNTNLVKINGLQLISPDVTKVETPDTELFSGFEVTSTNSDKSLTIKFDDSDDKISLKKDGIVSFLGDRFNFRINEDGNIGALVVRITEPGTYEFFAEVANISTDYAAYTTFDINSSTSPSILYYDFDEGDGDEQLNFTINNAKREIKGTNNFTYNTTIYKKDGDDFIAWIGEPYFVVESGGDWYLSKLLLDEDVDDTHLLRVGETLTLPAGFAVTPLEIDVDGGEAWFSVTQDGEEVDSSVVNENATFQYKADLNESGSEDNWVLKFKVETVFAGMNTNLVKINGLQLISPDVTKVETPDTEIFSGFEVTSTNSDKSLTIKFDDSDDKISLKKDGIVSFLGDRFNFRINEDGTMGGILKVVEVGGEVTPTPTPTEEATEEATVEATETEVGGAEGTATAEATETVVAETPTSEPTKKQEPGFEAVFAIAGLLAVAYLVLRQRD